MGTFRKNVQNVPFQSSMERVAVHVFVDNPVKDFAAHPMIGALNAKFFEPDEVLSKVTRGPLA